MARSIEDEATTLRKRTGAAPLGVPAILAQNPASRPERIKKSPAPLLHAATKAMRQLFYEGFAAFVSAYRAAAEKLGRGDLAPPFPIGSFPPALPFVAGKSRRPRSLTAVRPRLRAIPRRGGSEGWRCIRRAG